MSLMQGREVGRRVPGRDHNVAIGYLRAFLTVLVVAHHAVLAYHPFAPVTPTPLAAEPRVWGAFPVVDPARSMVFALFTGFNDTFFMSLMFLLSGLFVWRSLTRKGAGGFLRDRAVRLGVPFLVGAALLAPLTYYPAYVQGGGTGGFGAFLREWSGLGSFPSGPVWFLWVLLAFNAIVAGLFALAPQWGERLGSALSGLAARPAAFFGVLFAVSTAVYLPLVHVFTPFHWLSVGPFQMQSSRVLHYFVYFVAGLAIGAGGLERTLLARDGRLARRWPLWLGASFVAFALSTAIVIVAFGPAGQAAPALWNLVLGVTFTLGCAASSAFYLALFLRFAPSPRPLLDRFQADAYGVYLLHFAVVAWIQYALLPVSMPVVLKGLTVIAGALVATWAAAAAVRRIPAVAKVL